MNQQVIQLRTSVICPWITIATVDESTNKNISVDDFRRTSPDKSWRWRVVDCSNYKAENLYAN